MRTIDADRFEECMYREAFEKDSDMQRWDSGCWIRYKLLENVLKEQPTVETERKWIPIGEASPTENGEYQITYISRTTPHPFIRGTELDFYGKPCIGMARFRDGQWEEHFSFFGEITAWAPIKLLTDPYQGGKQDEQ